MNVEREGALPSGTGVMGLAALLASLSILFLSGLAGFWIIRARAIIWSDNLPGLPSALWVSTAALVLLGFFVEKARSARKGNDLKRAHSHLRHVLICGLVFTVFQFIAWLDLSHQGLSVQSGSLYAFNFFFFTGLHVIHVLGGLIYTGFVYAKSKKGLAFEEQYSQVALYWHFLSAVWLVIVSSILLANASFVTPWRIYLGFLGLAGLSGFLCACLWIKTLIQLVRFKLWWPALVSIFPPMAYAFVCIEGKRIQLSTVPILWGILFALFLFSLSVALATGVNLGELLV